MPFSVRRRIHFQKADLAGVLFFGRVYELAHEAFEEFVVHLGDSWNDWFENPEWGIPIRSSGCEYRRPLPAGSEVTIEVGLESLGETSFTSTYKFTIDGQTCCEVRLVQTFVDRKTWKKTPMPSKVRSRFEAYQRQCATAQ